jgi:hypothetical protein
MTPPKLKNSIVTNTNYIEVDEKPEKIIQKYDYKNDQ